jgi:hypothetical protein
MNAGRILNLLKRMKPIPKEELAERFPDYVQDEPIGRTQVNDCFSYYIDGSTEESALVGAEDGEPYVVQSWGGGWIPISVVVFAYSNVDACKRVIEALWKAKANYSRLLEEQRALPDFDYHGRINRYEEKIERIEKMERISLSAAKLDKRLCMKANWGDSIFRG